MTVFDPGLQPERTLLAWRRTCLALGVGSAVAARFAAPQAGALAAALGLCGVVLALAAYLAAGRRHRRAHDALTAGRALAHQDAVPLALLAGALAALASACAAYVLWEGIR